MELLTNPEAWLALATLTALEIVLGIDNIIFIAILAGELPKAQQHRARITGLAFAMVTRLLLLFSLTWLMGLTAPFFTLLGHGFSGRDLILLAGGLFLIAKSTMEIHDNMEGVEGDARHRAAASFTGVIAQIAILDIIFSLDSIITAIGMANQLAIMAAAVVVAVFVMMFFAGAISAFVNKHPTIKILALSFLILIGVALVADSLGLHIPKGYIYFSMAFSLGVEMLNIRLRRGKAPVKLHSHYE
jgi:predicted tellurium resistance membrane protein TerC